MIAVATATPVRVSALEPDTLTVVAAPATRLTTFAVVPAEVKVMVSIEGIVTTAGPVTLVTVRACVSLVPETADATYPNVAPKAVLLSAKATAVLLRLSTCKAATVVPEDVIEV